MLSAAQALEALLDKRRSQGLLRTLRSDNHLIDFCSNDYLGFARNPKLEERARNLLEGEIFRLNGSTGSRLIRGNTTYVEDLEKRIAGLHSAEAALLFNSGYDANIGLFASVPQRADTVLYDRAIHASIRDGIRLSGARSFGFEHNAPDDLRRLHPRVSGNVFVAVESVYSMDGDLAPLNEIMEVCREFGWNLMVDEAHAIGVFGEHGAGLVNKEMAVECFARIYTYGKAMGAHGAAVVGSDALRRYLINFARSFIYTTALPPASHALIDAAYQLAREAPEYQVDLHRNIEYFNRMKPSQLPFSEGNSPIKTLVLGENEKALKLAEQFRLSGMDVRAILSPTVPKGKELVRISLHAFNSRKELDSLLQLLHTQY